MNEKEWATVPDLEESERWYNCQTLDEAIERIKAIELMQSGHTYTLTKWTGTRERYRSVPHKWGIWLFRFTWWKAVESREPITWWEITEQTA